jgi:hypothetical protein
MNKAKPQAITAAESPQSTAELGGNIARALRQRIAAHEERAFEDDEHKVRPLDPVRPNQGEECNGRILSGQSSEAIRVPRDAR